MLLCLRSEYAEFVQSDTNCTKARGLLIEGSASELIWTQWLLIRNSSAKKKSSSVRSSETAVSSCLQSVPVDRFLFPQEKWEIVQDHPVQ